MSVPRTIPDAERRARLGRRHALAPDCRAGGALDAARAVVALHATDPASVVLAAVARGAGSIAEVEHALYEERSLVRVLAMRRTLFAVPRDVAPHCVAAAGDVVAGAERRRLIKELGAALDAGALPTGRTAEELLAAVEQAVVEALAEGEPLTGQQLGARPEPLSHRLLLAPGKRYETSVSLVSRVLPMLSAQGTVVRGRPRGGWRAGQFAWTLPELWLGEPFEELEVEASAAELARRWLARFGPATDEDLAWWAGWTKTRTRRALRDCGAEAVRLEDGAEAWVEPGDAEPEAAPAPWAALLPGLDPTTMGWKQRDWYLDPGHRGLLFDRNGNAGATIWVDGRIVGAWGQREDGEIRTELLDDPGTDAKALVDERVVALQGLLGGERLALRARDWSSVERRLRG